MRFSPPSPLHSMCMTGCGPSGAGVTFTGALDDYTTNMVGAWSVSRRMLLSYEGALIRVRRDSDDAETDVDPDASGDLDTAALATFVGAGSAYVVKVYDQSGLSHDMLQTTPSLQMQIVNSGSLIVDSDGLPAMTVITTNAQFYATGAFTNYTGNVLSVFSAGQIVGSNYERIISIVKDSLHDYDASTVTAIIAQASNSAALGAYRSGGLASLATTLGSAFSVMAVFDGANYTINNAGGDSSAASSGNFDVNRVLWAGEVDSAGNCVAGSIHRECVAWFGDQTANVASILASLSP